MIWMSTLSTLLNSMIFFFVSSSNLNLDDEDNDYTLIVSLLYVVTVTCKAKINGWLDSWH